jgi:hypothetical protein
MEGLDGVEGCGDRRNDAGQLVVEACASDGSSAAEKYGAETELFAADALDLPMYMPDAAVRSDKARHLVKALARCDAVIIASPGYHGAVRPGQERTGLRRRPA